MQWNTLEKTENSLIVSGNTDRRSFFASVWPSILLLFSGIISGGLFMFAYYNNILADVGLSSKAVYIPQISDTNRLTSPLLECRDTSDEIKPFKGVVEELLSKKKSSGEIAFFSVYFRDLNNGPWFGINEREPIKTAGALRLPILLWYLRQAVYNPAILRQTAIYPEEVNPIYTHEGLMDEHSLKFNQIFTASELLEVMIEFRDMHATSALRGMFQDFDRRLDSVYSDLGITQSSQDVLTLRNFGSLFRVLFNASYLDLDNSEYALKLLSRSARDGIAEAIPDSIPVAHTLGVNTFEEFKQMHACGIVYYPGNPYLLCTAVRGDDFNKLKVTIRDVSAVVYQEISRQIEPD